jgi:aspartate/methionine/tyrosine aminotransferase
MRFPEFLLDRWLNEHDGKPFNLACSMGPPMTLADLAALTGADVERLLTAPVVYPPAEGGAGLRAAVAGLYDVSPDDVQILTGASEALVVLFALAAEPGASVVLPFPCYPAMTVLAQAFGVEVRHYTLARERGFAIDPDEVARLVDAGTRFVIVNSPHNPTGATVSDEEMDRLYATCESRGVPLVSDEVYHPLYFGRASSSAARLPRAVVLGSCSKAFSLSGVRVGWMIDRDPERRARAWNARAALTISNTSPGEAIAELALGHAGAIIDRARAASERNLARLDAFFADHGDRFGWVRPSGGTIAFPWLKGVEDARPWCQAMVDGGVVLAPGDCFGMPGHFRVGFGREAGRFAGGLARLEQMIAAARP